MGMIDWYVIEYLYPMAFKKFIKSMFPNVGVVSTSTLKLYDYRKLYRFFDKEGIYLNIEMYNPNQWVFSISLENGIVFGPTQTSKPTREEVEIDGFFECFKILEKKLN
jgi:hypothetical protein